MWSISLYASFRGMGLRSSDDVPTKSGGRRPILLLGFMLFDIFLCTLETGRGITPKYLTRHVHMCVYTCIHLWPFRTSSHGRLSFLLFRFRNVWLFIASSFGWVMVWNIRSVDVFICMYVLHHNACIACVLWLNRVAFWSCEHACFVYFKEYRVGLFCRRLRLL